MFHKKFYRSKISLVLATLVSPVAAQANIASTIESINALEEKSSYQINDIIFLSQLQKRVITNSRVNQASYGILSELEDVDSDSTLEAPAMRMSIAGYTPPTNGGFVPSSSLSPKTDGYGMPMGLCVWDHGPTNSSTNRITGSQTVTNADISFGVLSSGADRTFSTGCADVSGNAIKGDDVMVIVTVGQGNFGIASSQNKFFKSPVADKSTLLSLDTSSSEPGEMRLVLDTGMAYAWLDLNNDGTFQWEAVSSHFYSGDSNGATAGGEYTTNPYKVGIGAKFADKTLSPASTLEVDGKARIVNGSGLVDTDGNAQLHIGNQEAPSGTAGEVTRLAIQPYGHTGGPFNFVARDDGSSAYLDLRYGATTARTLISGKSTGGKQYVGINNPDPQATLDVAGNLYAESAAWNVLRKKKSSYSTAPYDDGLIMFEFTNAYSSGYATGGRTDNPLTIFASRSVEYNSSPIHHYEAKSQGYYNHPNVNYLSRIQYGSLNRGSYYFRAQEYYQKKVWDDEFWIKGGGHSYFKGKMGIGTQTPQEKLHVQDGSIRLQGDTKYVAYHALRTAPAASTDDDGDGYERFSMGIHSGRGSSHVGSSFGLEFLPNIDASTTPAMSILENGKVGIGTTAPSSDLDVVGLITSDRLSVGESNAVDYVGQIQNASPLAKGLLISGGDSGKDASLLKVQNSAASQQFFEVSDGRVAIGSGTNDTEFCLNGDCASKVRTVKTGSATLNNSTFTKIAYVDGASLYSTLDLSIQGGASNVVVNSDFYINVGHNQSIYVESQSQAYTEIELKIHAGYDASVGSYNDEADFIISARLISNDGPANVNLQASLRGDAKIAFNPTTQSVTSPGTEHIHKTKKIGKSISGTSKQRKEAGLFLNDNPVLDTTGRNHKVTSSGLSPGWYTIATNKNNRATARFGIRDTTGGMHQSTIFYASTHFGNNANINVISHGVYNKTNTPVKTIRIVTGGVADIYAGALLQVYVNNSGTNLEAIMLGDNFQWHGWELVDWVPHGTDPGTVDNFTAINQTESDVHLNMLKYGGFATSENLHMASSKAFGGSNPTDNANTAGSIIFGTHPRENLQIFKQGSGGAPTYCGSSVNNDCYMFTMFDNNSVDPDASIQFGGIGVDDIYEKYFTINGQGKTYVNTSSNASMSSLSNAFTIQTKTGRGSMGSLNTSWFHVSTDRPGFYFYKPITAVGGFNTASDIRLKKDIKSLDSALEGIRKLNGYSYGWRSDEFPERGLPANKREYGVIAQDLEPLFPELVTTSGDGFKTVNYDGLIPVLIEATKEIDQKTQEIEDRVDQHESDLKEYMAKVDDQEGVIRAMKQFLRSRKSSNDSDDIILYDEIDGAEKSEAKQTKDKSEKETPVTQNNQGDLSRFYR